VQNWTLHVCAAGVGVGDNTLITRARDISSIISHEEFFIATALVIDCGHDAQIVLTELSFTWHAAPQTGAAMSAAERAHLHENRTRPSCCRFAPAQNERESKPNTRFCVCVVWCGASRRARTRVVARA